MFAIYLLTTKLALLYYIHIMSSETQNITAPLIEKPDAHQEMYDMFDGKNINNKKSYTTLQKYQYSKGLIGILKVDPAKGLDTKDQEDINTRKRIYGTNDPIPIKFDSFCSMVSRSPRYGHNSKTKLSEYLPLRPSYPLESVFGRTAVKATGPSNTHSKEPLTE
jgi:hypothetical protein